MLAKTVKGRVDRSLTGAGATSQKIVSFAWDPGFTCKTKRYNYSLSSQIQHNFGAPIISDCFFHSAANRSVVAVGYNLESFTVNWPGSDHSRHTASIYGYYFEMDYGIEHQRVSSLMYTQLYDPYDVVGLADKGWVKVQPSRTNHSCIFTYDFS